MSFADALVESAAPKTTKCGVTTWLAAQSPQDRAAAQAALADARMMGTTIHRAMRATGYDAGLASVQRHRRGDCKCPSPTN